jgi:hypothetical protein
MSIATSPTFVQVHAALQSIILTLRTYLPCVQVLAVGTAFTMSTAGKIYCSTSRQSVSALAGLLTGEIIRCRAGPATLSTLTMGKPSAGWQRWSESFGLGVAGN